MTRIAVLEGTAAESWMRAQSESLSTEDARAAVAPIVKQVRDRGDAALREYSATLDRVSLTEFAVAAAQLRSARAATPEGLRSALEQARDNLEAYHRSQLRSESRVTVAPGITVWRVFRPIERVGIYVPGGRSGYPSSLLMAGIPARLAGCAEIIVCTPPADDGVPPTATLAAAELLGIDRVFAVGGAQAIAALAFGTESIPRVDKIFGPGNSYVTAAKELVHGSVNIDMPAGPSEVVVLADRTARPDWVAADVISQAEHGPDSLAVAVTTSRSVADDVAARIAQRLSDLPDPGAASESLARSAILAAPDLDTAISWANRLAPEHLALMTEDDEGVLARIGHAGSVFLGDYSAVAAGDYASGANHVLPTAGRARAWSALSVDDFGRWMQAQHLSREGLDSLATAVSALARWEGFEAHARAIEARFEVAQ